MENRSWKFLAGYSAGAQALLFGLAYYACAQAGYYLAYYPGHAVTLWLPSGLFIGSLLRCETRKWPWLVLGALPAQMLFDLSQARPWVASLGFWMGYSAEALAGAWMIRRFISERPRLNTMKEVFGLVGLSALLSTMLSATAGATLGVNLDIRYFDLVSWGENWLVMWSTNLLGVLAMAPAVLTWESPGGWPEYLKRNRRRLAEAALIFALFIGLILIFLTDNSRYGFNIYLAFPMALWIVLRFGTRGAALAGLTFSLLAVWCTWRGHGDFADQNVLPIYQNISLQIFLAVNLMAVMVLAAMLAERRRMHEAVQESEKQYRQLVELAQEGIWSIDAQDRTTYVNPRMAEMLGFSMSELLNRSLNDFMQEHNMPFDKDKFASRKRGIREQYDAAFQRKDGSILHASLTVGPLVDDAGHYAGSLAMVADITERKRSEEALKKEKEKLETASKAGRIALWEWRIGTGEIEWGGAVDEMAGYPPGGFARTYEAWLKALHPSDQPRTLAAVSASLDQALPYDVEYRVRRADGNYVWWRAAGTLLEDAGGKHVKMSGATVDITQRKEAEEALHRRLAFERLVTAISRDFINLPLEHVDERIQSTLRDIGMFVGADRSCLFQLTPGGDYLINVHQWVAEGIEPQSNPMQEVSVAQMPWLMGRLLNGRVVSLPHIALLPREAAAEQQHYQDQCVQSIILVPLSVNQRVIGILRFDAVQVARDWDDNVVSLIQMVADIFANLIDRRQSEESLRRNEASLERRTTQLEALHQLSLGITSEIELPVLLQTIRHHAMALFNAPICNFYFHRPELSVIELYDLPETLAPLCAILIKKGEGLCGLVWETGKPQVIQHYRTWEKRLTLEDHFPGGAALGAPIQWGKEFLGVIIVMSDKAGAYDSTDAQLIGMLATHTALAIKNSSLLSQVRRDAEVKTTLLHDVNHRVGNNLNRMIEIIHLEQERLLTAKTDFSVVLQDLESCIQGMNVVHRLLSSNQWAPLPLADVVTEVLRAAFRGSSEFQNVKLVFQMPLDPLWILPEQTTALALILNELATNSLKYAFGGRPSCVCTMQVHPEAPVKGRIPVRLTYQDDGPGWPDEVLQGQSQGVGMHLIRETVRSPLRGEIQLRNDSGAVAEILFKLARLDTPDPSSA